MCGAYSICATHVSLSRLTVSFQVAFRAVPGNEVEHPIVIYCVSVHQYRGEGQQVEWAPDGFSFRRLAHIRDGKRYSTGSVSHWFTHKSRDAFSALETPDICRRRHPSVFTQALAL